MILRSILNNHSIQEKRKSKLGSNITRSIPPYHRHMYHSCQEKQRQMVVEKDTLQNNLNLHVLTNQNIYNIYPPTELIPYN